MRIALIAALVLLAATPAAAQGFTLRFSGDIIVPAGHGREGAANGRIDRQPGAQVRGEVQSSTAGPPGSLPPMTSRRWDGRWAWGWPGMMRAMATWTFVSFVALAAIASALFPLQVRRIAGGPPPPAAAS